MVGSASFNLLVVTAVSIVSVNKAGKKIAHFNNFLVTLGFSCFASWVFLMIFFQKPFFFFDTLGYGFLATTSVRSF